MSRKRALCPILHADELPARSRRTQMLHSLRRHHVATLTFCPSSV